MDARAVARAPGAVAVGLLTGAFVAFASVHVGLRAALLPALAVGAVVLVLHPRATLALLVSSVVILEDDPQAFLSAGRFYVPVAGNVHIADLLVTLIAAGVALNAVRGRAPLRFPRPLAVPLALLAAAIVMGVIVGATNPTGAPNFTSSVRNFLTLLTLPVLTVNVLRTPDDVRLGYRLIVGLVLYKAATGLLGYLLGIGRGVDGTVLTYYAPTANLLALGFVLVVVAALIAGDRLPLIVRWLTPFAGLVLLLSFRRNFWIALVAGLVLVTLVATGRRGRALLLPAGLAIAASLYVAVGVLSTTQSESPVVQRVKSLSPTQVQIHAYDRYRLDEQKNVIAEIRKAPLTGIGLGVPWRATAPLAVTFDGARNYSHVVVLLYWLKLGLVGLLAYLTLVGAVARAGLRVWYLADDPRDRPVGLGVAATMIGLALAETTGSFLGVDTRLTVTAAACIGALCTLDMTLPAGRDASGAWIKPAR